MTTFTKPADADLGQARVLWAACCLSPVIYLAIAIGLDRWLLVPAGRKGFWTLEPATLASVQAWCLGILLLLAAGAVFLRLRAAVRPRAAGSIRRRTLWLVGLAECCLWPGVVLFVLGAGLRPMFVAGATAFMCYALAYPQAGCAATGSADRNRQLTD
ncbi:MAG: hypothetical protein N2111_03315 [Candidatus Sumerlaeaceae bacterium]|nr:hypothetical protein [Candidatus Sumerlaeaceae bacterium]